MKMLSGYNIANMKSESLGDLNSSDRKKKYMERKNHTVPAFKKLTV